MKWVCAAIGVFGFSSVAMGQASSTFNGLISNSWHVDGNWSNHVPTPTTDAYIPDDRTCVIDAGDASAARLFISSGGVVQIDSKGLTLSGIYDYLPHLEVDGKLEFKKSGTTTPFVSGKTQPLQVWGTGVIDARSANGLGPGRIIGDASIDFFQQPTTDPLEVRGSVTFEPHDYLYLSNCKFIVDNANDDMQFGPTASGSLMGVAYSHSNALIKVSAGVIEVGRVQFGGDDADFLGTIRAEGTGVFRVADLGITHTGKGNVEVAGGTFDFQSSWSNLASDGHHISHTAGKIKVKGGKVVSFQ